MDVHLDTPELTLSEAIWILKNTDPDRLRNEENEALDFAIEVLEALCRSDLTLSSQRNEPSGSITGNAAPAASPEGTHGLSLSDTSSSAVKDGA